MRSLIRSHKLAFVLGGMALWAALVVSCEMVSRPILAPPQIAGAQFVGSDGCIKCHAAVTSAFHDATHAHLTLRGDDGKNKSVGCESCHGPGSLHVKAGTAATIINPRASPQACFQCHANMRAEFSLPHAHPVIAGKVGCADCHDPHKGDAVAGGTKTLTASINQTCVKCHQAQAGPFAFEHEAMRDGCVICHTPHGSVNDKLLKARNRSLCNTCHAQVQTNTNQAFIGGVDHTAFTQRGTCWTSSCHEAVHGSHVNSSLRY